VFDEQNPNGLIHSPLIPAKAGIQAFCAESRFRLRYGGLKPAEEEGLEPTKEWVKGLFAIKNTGI
jgi:hypothetical protein